ncbi:hypothetical protein GCM10017322_33570 [Paracoccus aerius]|nr:hypothetical protein GCM10017322_33570 [Paracoccus aerius]
MNILSRGISGLAAANHTVICKMARNRRELEMMISSKMTGSWALVDMAGTAAAMARTDSDESRMVPSPIGPMGRMTICLWGCTRRRFHCHRCGIAAPRTHPAPRMGDRRGRSPDLRIIAPASLPMPEDTVAN